MRILNSAALGTTEARRAALEIAEAGLAAIDTSSVIRANVRLVGERLCVGADTYSLTGVKRIYVVGVGKCALAAAEALEAVLGDKLAGGIVLGVEATPRVRLQRIRYLSGTHPLPTEQNIRATGEVVQLLKDLQAQDLVIVVVSGGGSTLLCQPNAGVTCVDEAALLQSLFRVGATIQDINTIRKHLSLARGGQLATYAYPAEVIALIFSDVPGNDLTTISSGPTVKDTTTVADAVAVLRKYGLPESLPLAETPKDDKYFARVRNILLVSNTRALEAMAEAAKQLSLTPTICTDCLTGEAHEIGAAIVAAIRADPPNTARLYGGETTVTLRGHGKGGRNQELALATLRTIADGEVVLALASDGRDHSDAAGAVCDTMTVARARTLGLDIEHFLNANDSYTFFQQVGDGLMTGDTGANVSDLLIALKH